MRHALTRPGFPRVVLTAAFALAAIGVSVPAYADTTTELGLTLPDSLVLATGERDTVNGVLTLTPAPSGSVTLHDVEVLVDVTALSGIARVDSDTEGRACEATDSTVTCPLGDVEVPDGELDLTLFRLEGLVGPTTGVSVDIPVTVSSAGHPSVWATVAVTRVDAVALSTGDDPVHETTVAPGGTAQVPVSVANVGDTAADGAALVLRVDTDLRIPGAFGNCRYNESIITCRFVRELAPGRRFELSNAIGFAARATAEAPGLRRIEYRWYTLDTYDARVAPGLPDDLRAGSGPDVTLVERTDAGIATTRDPSNYSDSGTFDVRVDGDNPVDLAATGTGFTGESGTTATLTIGVRNVSRVDVPAPGGTPRILVTVTLPDGVSYTDTSNGCRDTDQQNAYECALDSDLAPGQTRDWTFTVHIDRSVPDAEGTVTVRDTASGDGVPANDTVAILANPTGEPTSEPTDDVAHHVRTTATPPIAVTGLQLRLLAVGGLLALCAGVSLYVLTRLRHALESRRS